MAHYPSTVVKVQGDSITVHRINNDTNGNPRYVVHFLALGLNDYDSVPFARKYRAEWFGGGYVFSSYNLEQDLNWMVNQAKAWEDKK